MGTLFGMNLTKAIKIHDPQEQVKYSLAKRGLETDKYQAGAYKTYGRSSVQQVLLVSYREDSERSGTSSTRVEAPSPSQAESSVFYCVLKDYKDLDSSVLFS